MMNYERQIFKGITNQEYKEPTTKNNLEVDCISREQAIEEADKLCLETSYDNEKVIEMLNELPLVTPIRPKGHWIKVTNGRGGHECDVCHDYAPSFQNGDENLSDYCPNCGADLREVEE